MRLPRIALTAVVAPLLIAAQTSPAPVVTEAWPEPASSLDKVVCKKMPPPVGSRIGPRKVCKTQAEWDAIRDSDREAIDTALRKPCTAEGAGGPTGCQ